jgi:hypothetical protein
MAEQIGRIAYELVTWPENYRAVASPEGETKRSLTRVIGKSTARALAGNCGEPVLFIVQRARVEARKAKV